MGDGQGHGCQPLGCRVHHDHGVLLPKLASRLVPNTSPQVDDFFAMTVHATRPADFFSTGEVLDERISHGLEALADASMNSGVCDYPSPSIGRRSERKFYIAVALVAPCARSSTRCFHCVQDFRVQSPIARPPMSLSMGCLRDIWANGTSGPASSCLPECGGWRLQTRSRGGANGRSNP